jgi:hypothetical protein
MPKSSKDTRREIELIPDAWERFERAVEVVAKTPPQHRVAKKTGKKAVRKKASKKAVR